ncbi:MAG TPA: response regulator [Bryobacterales bacterium]|nr:response regulator [Bryobacterales bacterium]
MQVAYSHSPLVVLITEDDLGDQILIREALQSSRIPKSLQIVGDGEEALEYLHRSGRYAPPARAPRPDLILLDLNMPRLGGKELLARLKADDNLRTIPVVAFTTSGREEDITQCYAMGVNSYVQKPTDFDQFQAVLQRLEQYWLEVSLFPPRLE